MAGKLAPDEAAIKIEPRGRVWIVEDSPLEAEMARRALGPEHDVELFSDGSAVVERVAEEGPPDALVLDWHMPGLTGIDTCQFLRAKYDPAELPILMLTVQGSKQDLVDGLTAGANDYLTKPYDVLELRARVRILVRASKFQKEQAWRGQLVALDADLGEATTRSGSVAELGRLVADTLVRRLELDGASIWLANGGNGQLVAAAGVDLGDAVAAVAEATLRDKVCSTRDLFGAQVHAEALLVQSQAVGALLIHRRTAFPAAIVDAARGITDLLSLGLERARADAERKDLLARAEAARLDAENANRMKDEFLAMVSHELRTPLNAIAGWTKILLHSADTLDEKTVRGLETIDRNARAQTQLIDDLLDISRIIAGKVRLNVQSVELVQVVESSLDAVRVSAEAKGVLLETDLDRTPTEISGDVDRLQQIVGNLLSNAIKFTPKGGRTLVRLVVDTDHAELRVEDTGRGIAAEFLPHVFERFRQAEGSFSRSKGGLGLGLAIVRQLVDLHGGTISAESEGEGRGAKFIVRLPVARKIPRSESVRDTSRFMQASEAFRTFDCPKELVGMRILVVEDEPDARAMLREILTECRSVVYLASSAAEGLELLQQHLPDVLLSDVGMPGEDGFTFLRKVRALPKEHGGMTPAVALTAYARAEDRTRAMMAGFNTHVAKPIEPAELLLVIRNVSGRFS